jgi:hypothetical protein
MVAVFAEKFRWRVWGLGLAKYWESGVFHNLILQSCFLFSPPRESPSHDYFFGAGRFRSAGVAFGSQ